MQSSLTQDRKALSIIGRWAAFFLVLISVGGFGLVTLRKNVTSDKPAEISKYKVWKEEAIDASRNIAVQDGGRVKPFSTWAAFTMLNLHGSRSMTITVDGEKQKLGPEDILLDCLFRPEIAKELPLFRIDDQTIISSLATHNLAAELREHTHIDEAQLAADIRELQKKKGRRDRYSFNDLQSVAPVLLTKAQELRKKQPEKAKMTADTRNTVDLAEKIWLFMQLTLHMDFARADVVVRDTTPEMDKESMQRMSYWIRAFPILAQNIRGMDPSGQGMSPKLRELFGDLEIKMRRASENIRIVPPYDEDVEEWAPIGQRIERVISGDRTHAEALLQDMEMLENACIALEKHGQIKFAEALGDWKKSVHTRLGSEVVEKLDTEVNYNRLNYFYLALVGFIIAFLFIMFGWLAPRTLGSRICNWIAIGAGIIILLWMMIGITHRCIIMERSPVGNLYDTIIFIGTTGVLVLLLVEVMTKRAVALGLSIFMGMACMFLARRYEIGDGKDHMDPLVAVLKSNFWLSTHVVTVTIGYMGGLAAAGLSTIYLFARMLGIDEGDRKFRRAMTRIAYGMVCFTLFFSLIGTVLGGIWANDSWGRFWGWDPKENGALMIVLWCLAVLHARLAGYIKEWGIHIAGVFGANIVAFSWWHVNSLSTGLHSYGFIDGIGFVWVFYGLMGGICLLGMIASIITNRIQALEKNSGEGSAA